MVQVTTKLKTALALRACDLRIKELYLKMCEKPEYGWMTCDLSMDERRYLPELLKRGWIKKINSYPRMYFVNFKIKTL